MTAGSVTRTRKPLVPITMLDQQGHRHTLRVVLDTGFTGELLLPERYVRRFRLTLSDEQRGRPATGEFVAIPSGTATVIWQGRQRTVRVLQLGAEPLLGMALLWNNRITIDAVTDGPVTINPLGG